MDNLEQLYVQVHEGSHHHIASIGHGSGTEGLLSDCNSLLDVGAGYTQYAKHVASMYGLVYATTDITDVVSQYHDNYFKCYCWDMPFEDQSFDAITAFDVLEHVPEDKVDLTIQEFFRIARKKLVLRIASNSSKFAGKELHLTQKPLQWWINKIRSHPLCTDIRQFEAYSTWTTRKGDKTAKVEILEVICG